MADSLTVPGTHPDGAAATGGLRGVRLRVAFPYLNAAVVLAIVALDWITPAGVVVGILLAVPIMAASMSRDPRQVWLVFGVAVAGKIAAAAFGAGPISPAAVWVPNRVFAFLTLPATFLIALRLQESRIAAERGRDLNRLLLALLAHDLRSPLALAHQGLEYVEQKLPLDALVDRDLLADLRVRLRKSLGTIDALLSVARHELHRGAHSADSTRRVRVTEEIEATLTSFQAEAAAQGKTLHLDLQGLNGGAYGMESGDLLRQALSILLDNAIRHAVSGPVHVTARADSTEIVVRVADTGPGLSATRRNGGAGRRGSGMGLDLCRALAQWAGGRLEVERDGPEGTTFALGLPAVPVEGSGTPPG